MYDTLAKLVVESWQVLGLMSPYLLLGFLIAGALSVWISPEWVERHLGGSGMWPALKASALGVPLPLCSCGVIPVAVSIRRHGASRTATTAFLLSTPQTGVDSIAVTYALLGPVFAVFRPLAALVTGVVGGALVRLFGEPEHPLEATPVECADACCDGKGKTNPIVSGLRYGLVTLPADIGPALLVGVLIAGAMGAFIQEKSLAAHLGSGILSILLLMAAGAPIYVCATASVPIAAGFMRMGASPGAALAFLIAGPATNAATFTTIWKALGRRTALLYLVTVAASAIGCGLALDWLAPAAGASLPQFAGHAHAQVLWINHASAVALLAVLLLSYLSGRRRSASADERAPGDGLRRMALLVTGMTCSHCADAVKRALEECDGVREADVDLRGGRAVVTGGRLDQERLVAAVTAAGYEAGVADGDDHE